MNQITTVIYIIAAILIFGLLIMIHEYGHYRVARWCGVGIEEFSIGMGPKIYQRKSKKDGMLFSIRALPIGGYVSMLGEDEDKDDPASFGKKNVWQRIAIVVAGATMNLLLGFLIVFIIVCTTKSLASTTIYDFSEKATSNAQGGLMAEDEVLKVGGVSVHTGEELVYEIMNQGYEPIEMTVLRDGQKVTLKDVVFPNIEDSGIVFGDCDFRLYVVSEPSVWQLVKITWHRSVSLVKMVWDSLFNLVTGRFGIGAMSGPIGVTAAVQDTISESGWNGIQILNYVMYITAVISINLGVMNLLPFPALDGGRFLFLLIELIRRKRISQDIEAKINLVGMVLLLGFMFFITCKDIIGLF